MADTHGFNLRVAAGIEAAYGTEILVDQLLPALSFEIDAGSSPSLILRNALMGSGVRVGADLGLITPAPPINLEYTIDLGKHILANFMGSYTDGRAEEDLTISVQPTPGDTITIGTRTYTFQANGSLTNVAYNIEVGLSLGATQLNIFNAVMRAGTPGTGYAALTPANDAATMSKFTANVATVKARVSGSAGDAIATTSVLTEVGDGFGSTTLSGGDRSFYTLLSQIGDQGLTIASDLGTKLAAFRGLKIGQMQFIASVGEPLVMQCTTFALARIIGSSTNTSAVIAALPIAGTRFFLHDFEGGLWIGDHADALDEDDDTCLSGFNLTVNRSLSPLHCQSRNPDKIVENDFQSVTLGLNHPVYESTDAFLAWQAAGTPLQAKFAAAIGAHSVIFNIPNMKIDPFAISVGGPQLVAYDTPLMCFANPGVNPFMSVAEALEIEEV